MTGDGSRHPSEIGYVHLGAFSGSAVSLRAALAARVQLATLDLQSVTREPRLLAARAAARSEALFSPGRVHWAKTAAWSRALEARYERDSSLRARPTIFVQSLPAFSQVRVPYVVYTDRVALEGRAQSERYLPNLSKGWLRREQTFLTRAEKVFVMGPSTVPFLLEDYRLPPERVEVVGAGPNAPVATPSPSTRARRLLFIGTQWELKGGPDLLTAFSTLRREMEELELTIAGSVPPDALPRGVDAVGRVSHDEVRELIEHAHIVVIPTYAEAFGISLLEAISAGVPCIGTDIGNQAHIIADAGEIVAPGDPDELAASLRRVIADYPRYRDRALRRAELVRRQWTWPRVAEALLAALGSRTDHPS